MSARRSGRAARPRVQPSYRFEDRAKIARALLTRVIGTLQLRLLPRQAPVQERNFQPFAGVAVSRTGTYEGNDDEQRGRQVMPDRELRTVPRPPTLTVSRNTIGAKSAATFVPAAAVMLQPPAPAHDPPQRTSLLPADGVAVRLSGVPAFHAVVQVRAHCIPGTFALTCPGPEIVTVTGCCRSSCTSQAESCESPKPAAWP